MRCGFPSASHRAAGNTGSRPRRCSPRSTAPRRREAATAGSRWSWRRAASRRRSPLRLRPVDDLLDQLRERELASVLLRRGIVITVHGETLPLPYGGAFALVHDLDVHDDLHLTLGHRHLPDAGLHALWHVGIVAH